jgi:hypothetical protein
LGFAARDEKRKMFGAANGSYDFCE